MVEYSSDEERFAALVNFFKDNKNILLIVISVISVFFITSISLNSYNNSQNEKAAEIYDAWFSTFSNDSKEGQDYYNSLQTKYSNTGYAQLATMIKASSFAKEGDLDSALIDFSELLDASSGIFGNEILSSIAKINIARIELSKGNYTDVLKTLESFNSNSEHSLVYEIKGDALLGLQKNDLALDQYSLALENTQNESQKSLIKMKINRINN